MSRQDQGDENTSVPSRLDGNEPVADYKSKTVMMAAERHDNVQIVDVIETFRKPTPIPEKVSVIKRTETFYGPELFVHASVEGRDYNYLINAPGPGSHLHLWGAETTDNLQRREGWILTAEIKAALSAEQPPYERCGICGETIRTIEHERESAMGTCNRGRD